MLVLGDIIHPSKVYSSPAIGGRYVFAAFLLHVSFFCYLFTQNDELCNALHLVERRNGETPDTVDINGQDTIIRLEASLGKRAGNLSEGIEDGSIDVGTKGRKNVKKPKRQLSEKKVQKAEQKPR